MSKTTLEIAKLYTSDKTEGRSDISILAEAVVELTKENGKLKNNCNSDKLVTQSQALKEAEGIMRDSISKSICVESAKEWLAKHGGKK